MNNRYEDVAIKVFAAPGTDYATYDARDEGQVIDLVRSEVLPREKVPVHSVNMKVKRREDGAPEFLLAYLLRRDTYTADVVRVDVDANYAVQDLADNYADLAYDEVEEELEEYEPYEDVDFVVATPVPEIPTARQAVDNIHQMALGVNLKSKRLLGHDATVENYKRYLASGLRGFVNIGHGSPSFIILDDGTLNAQWFQNVSGKRLNPAMVYFNSCQVFNNPLQPAIMHAGARTFIGGIVNLAIGPSEEVCTCFWEKALCTNTPMGTALKKCEQMHYPIQGAHGISGDLKAFNFISSSIDQYKVVIYGEDALAGDLVAYIHCYKGNQNVASCEFYRNGSTLPKNRYQGGRIGLTYPESSFDEVLDVLRNEKPLYCGFIMSTKVGYIASHKEPVGEGSDES